MTKWDKNAKKREKALKLLLDTFLENVYNESMIYGEDKNRDGFCKYLTGQGEAIDLVLENHKDIKDGEVISNAWKQMITKKALMGYRQGLINVGEIKE